MTKLTVNLQELDSSKPSKSFTIALDEYRLGAEGQPTLVPSEVDLKVTNGVGSVDVAPGAYRVRSGYGPSAWTVNVPESGEHDLMRLILLQNAEVSDGVVEQIVKRLTALEAKPEPEPFDPSELEAENTALKTKVEKLQAQLDKIPPAKPVDLTSRREFDWDLASPLFEIGGLIASTIWMGRVDIAITVPVNEDSQRVLKDGVYFAGVPAPANVPVSRAMTAIGQDGTVKDITRAGLRAEFVSGKIRFYDRGSAPGGVFGAAIARGDEKIKIQFTYYTEEKYH